MSTDLETVTLPRLDRQVADLFEANSRIGGFVNVAGVVIDVLPPAQTSGTDLQFTFSLHDPISWTTDSEYDSCSGALRVKFFAREAKAFPKIGALGDIVYLRNLKMVRYRGSTQALSGFQTHWTVFPAKSLASNISPLPHWSSASAPQASVEEQAYVRYLHKWSLTSDSLRMKIERAQSQAVTTAPLSSPMPTTNHSSPPNELATKAAIPQPTPSRDRLIPLCDASEGRFCDVVAEVVKTFNVAVGKEIYITDYTENQQFYNYPEPDADSKAAPLYGDEYGYLPAGKGAAGVREWPGPWGQHVLLTMLFPPHAGVDLKPKDLVFIRNLRIARSKTGVHLEGKLHQDQRRLDQVDIELIKPDQLSNDRRQRSITALKERKEQYWSEHGRPKEAGLKAVDGGPLKTKAARRKEKKRKREEKERENREARAGNGQATTVATSGGAESNQHVRCGYHDKPLLPLESLIFNANRHYVASNGVNVDLPFVNMFCRAHLRVVDYFPPNLEEFARPAEITSQSDDGLLSSQRKLWKWSFYLLVQDACLSPNAVNPPRLKLLVADDGAECLLDLDAANLREDPSLLKRLKFRLSILWGNLHEVKTSANPSNGPLKLSNTPFYCCVQEYGVRMGIEGKDSQWRPVHRIVHTRIST